MRRLKISLIIDCVFLVASTTAYLLEAQEPRDWKNLSGKVVLKSGVLDVDRTLQDVQENVPTKIHVRTEVGVKSASFAKISEDDRNYVLQELGLSVSDKRNLKDLAPVSHSDELKSPKKEKRAFLVAASHYDSGLRSLSYTGNDVEDLKKRLLELGFREENIVVLRSGIDFEDVPTKRHIEDRYRRFLSRAQPGDLVFVYLSGHGLQLNESDVSYFAPVDVNLDDVENTSVSINEMMKQLSESPAEFRWMIVDACREDPKNEKSVFTTKSPGAKGMTKLDDIPKSISLLQSCQPGACSYEGGGNKDPNVRNGVFTLALLEALGEEGKGDLNGDGAVSFLEICQYATKRTNALANLYHNAEQIPNLSGRITDFTFLEGLAKGKAAKLYQEACVFQRQKKYSSALEKIRAACENDPENQTYSDLQKMLEDAEEARQAAARAESRRLASLAEIERLKAEKATANRRAAEAEGKREAAEKAEAERLAAEAEAARLESEKAKVEAGVVSETRIAVSSWPKKPKAGARATLTVNGVKFAFRFCPAGSFTMGSPSSEFGRDDDEVQRWVTISEGFWISETETTQEQWDAVGVKKEFECEFKGAKLPVENVTWCESDAFIEKLNDLEAAPIGRRFALPTEEQWEYACRAGTTGSTYGVPLDEAAWYYENHFSGSTHEVGTKKPNKWGIFDMLGNVSEWTNTKYLDECSFIERGGDRMSFARSCRPAYRSFNAPSDSNGFIGFRCVIVRR